ncbi:hypothetical protein [Paenibacillus terrae]|nr:hypothetical protein [Paenibacillus terrae]
MNKQEARELLRCHSFTHDDLDHPKMTNGFFCCSWRSSRPGMSLFVWRC